MKAMSLPQRIVISATDSGDEVNETRFPHVLANIMRGQLATADPPTSDDAPNDVLALFLATAKQVRSDFESANLAPTEHAQLDDNGDGKGTELDDLDDETLAQVDDPSLNLDGILAHRTSVPLQPESDTKKTPSPDDTP
jgi:hypothetical protein